MLSNSARDVDNVALKHDETMLMNASPVTGTPGMTQPFSLVVLLIDDRCGDNNRQTEWGHPDLEGVWNFSSDIPFQRFVIFDARRNLNNSDQRRAGRKPSTDERFVYGYDHFWYEMARLPMVHFGPKNG